MPYENLCKYYKGYFKEYSDLKRQLIEVKESVDESKQKRIDTPG